MAAFIESLNKLAPELIAKDFDTGDPELRSLSGGGSVDDSTLTPQELKVVQLIVQDKSNKDIADALFVSVSTIKTHINNIYKKLNVQSREDVKRLF